MRVIHSECFPQAWGLERLCVLHGMWCLVSASDAANLHTVVLQWVEVVRLASGQVSGVVAVMGMNEQSQVCRCPCLPLCFSINISRGRRGMCQLGGFSVVVVIVAVFLPTVCPVGGCIWGIFGKPLKRATWNTLGLHAVLTVFLRFLSVSDTACVVCCLFCQQAAPMSAYKFTPRAVASPDAPQKPLVRKTAPSGDTNRVKVTRDAPGRKPKSRVQLVCSNLHAPTRSTKF